VGGFHAIHLHKPNEGCPHAGEIAARVGVASDPDEHTVALRARGSDAEVARQALDPARAALEEIRDA
jgi:hypothetical protein